MLLEEKIGHLILAFQKSKEKWSELFGLSFRFVYFGKCSVRQENVHGFYKHFHQCLDIMLSTFLYFPNFLKNCSYHFSILEIYSTHKNRKEFVEAACFL